MYFISNFKNNLKKTTKKKFYVYSYLIELFTNTEII